MMADAAKVLGVELIVQTPHPSDPAVAEVNHTIFAAIDDAKATAQLAAECDVITFENEFINLEELSTLAQQGVCFRPALTALAPLLDKYDQRCYLQKIGLPVPQFSILPPSPQSPQFPLVLKARRHGYDGQGTFIIKDPETLEATLEKLQNIPLLIEEFIPFERELAVIAARSETGEVAIFPLVETQQMNQVCRWVIAPAELPKTLIPAIEEMAKTLLQSLDYVGLLGIELFLTSDYRVLVNEVAPRTHNSGHFTIDAAFTSQFEQHLRAVCNLPFGNPNLRCTGAVMVNLLGYENAQSDYSVKRKNLAEIPNAQVYWYGKSESRVGRKLGHVTVLLDTAKRETAIAIAQQVESIWYPD